MYLVADPTAAPVLTATDCVYSSSNSKLYVVASTLSSDPRPLNLYSVNVSTRTKPVIETTTRLFTSTGTLYANQIGRFSGNGNLYAAGHRVFDVSKYDAFLVKYNSDKNIQWQLSITQTASIVNPVTTFADVSVDNSENLYLVGSATKTNRGDIATIMKFNSSGAVLWRKGLIGVAFSFVDLIRCKTDSVGNTYAIGNYTSNQQENPVFVKYNSSGVLQWQISYSNTSTNYGRGRHVFVDSNDNIYVLLSGGNGSTATSTIMIIKYNSSRIAQWQRSIAIGDFIQLVDIKVANDGSVYIISYQISTAQNNGPGKRLIIFKYSDIGVLLWQRYIRSVSNFSNTSYMGPGVSIEIGDDSDLYIMYGSYASTSFIYPSSTTYHNFIARIPQDGGPKKIYTYESGRIEWWFSSYISSTISLTEFGLSLSDVNYSSTQFFTGFTSSTQTYTSAQNKVTL